MIKIGIIGSEGFVGQHLVAELKKNSQHEIYCFDIQPNSIFKHDNYKKINFKKNNNTLFKNLDFVYYLASSTIPASSYESPSNDITMNLVPFVNFMESIKMSGLKKIIYSSSAGTIYGSSTDISYENSLKNPSSPYGIIKLTAEYFLEYYRKCFGINYDTFRMSNIYGENQNTSNGLGLINTIIEKIISKEEIQIFGDGKSVRNFIYIKDVVRALSFPLTYPIALSDTVNLSSNDNLTVNSTIKIINKIVLEPFKINYLKSRNSDLKNVKIGNRKFLSKHPNFKFTSIEKGITKTYQYILKSKS